MQEAHKQSKLHKLSRMIRERRPLTQLRSFLEHNSVNVQSLDASGYAYESIIQDAAAEYFDTSIIDLLLDFGADPLVRDNFGASTLHYAVFNFNCPQMVGKILEVGCTFSDADEEGNRPIHSAAEIGNIPAVDTLLQAGENIEVRGQWNKTPLHFAASGRGENSLKMVQHLLSKDADLWATEENGFLPITEAHCNEEILSFLASTMPGMIKDWNSEEFIPFPEFIRRHKLYSFGCALVCMNPIKRIAEQNHE